MDNRKDSGYLRILSEELPNRTATARGAGGKILSGYGAVAGETLTKNSRS
jgi:hypothetical protein